MAHRAQINREALVESSQQIDGSTIYGCMKEAFPGVLTPEDFMAKYAGHPIICFDDIKDIMSNHD